MTKYFERCHSLLWFCTKILILYVKLRYSHVDTRNPVRELFSLFRRGQHYAKTWPMEKRLAPMFIENRTIRATRYAIRFMPRLPFYPVLADSVRWTAWPAVATALFALSLPMQGLWWLGKRSVTPLPPLFYTGFMKCVENWKRLAVRWHRLRVSRTIRRWRISSSVRLNSLIKHSSMTCD